MLTQDNEFICLSCTWAEKRGENRAYCNKVGFSCNGTQLRPTHICDNYEPKEGAQ